MKRLLLILFSYLVFVFAICVAAAFAFKGVPILLEADITPYKLQRGIRLFLDFLPALCLSCFTVSGTVYFAKNSEKCVTKFSPAMVSNFKTVMIFALIIVFLLTAAKEVVNPILQIQKNRYVEMPNLLNEYIEMGEKDFHEEKMLLAYGYAKQALKINPNDERAKQLLDKTQGAIEAMLTMGSAPPPAKTNEMPRRANQHSASTFELIRLAMSAYEKKNYFDAHYYADLALKSATTKNINYETAKHIRANAWNHLSEPVPEQDTAQNKFYREKQEAYTLLMNGNNLESYYKFLSLSKDARLGVKDPDITRYLAVAKERLDEMYFFIEETEDLYRFETAENVYFKISFGGENGEKEKKLLFYIRGVTTVKETGGMVQYLRGLQVFNYDDKGNFIYSMSVPYAKMLVLDTINLDDATKEKFHLEKLKQVPYLMLESISRTSNLDVIRPQYKFAENVKFDEGKDENGDDIEKFIFEAGKNFMIIPMPYNDFGKICDASNGLNRLDLISLFDLANVADKYGYSREVYNSTLVDRCAYPLEIMILMIFCATLAWGYRLKDGQVFKFKYIFILPIASFVFYFALKIVDFIFRFLTFTVVCYCGSISLVLSMVFWILLLIGLSVNFLGHKN